MPRKNQTPAHLRPIREGLLPNGTYSFVVEPLAGYHANLYAGTLVISGQNDSGVNLTWQQVSYAVSVWAVGLPPGVNWTVQLNSTVAVSLAEPLIPLVLSNGSYLLTVAAVSGYTVERSAIPIIVNGTALNVSFQFSKAANPWPLGLTPSSLGLYLLLGMLSLGLLLALFVALRRRNGPTDPTIAERVRGHRPVLRPSPVHSITIPAEAALDAGYPVDAPAPEPPEPPAQGPQYWSAPLLAPPDPVCWNCHFENPPGSRYCTQCAVPLSREG